jgi:hypothetical protein
VIELAEMAKLVHDDVVAKRRRQERDVVIEIQIAFLRAASPSRSLVANADAADFEIIKLVVVRKSRSRQFPRLFFVFKIFSPAEKSDSSFHRLILAQLPAEKAKK